MALSADQTSEPLSRPIERFLFQPINARSAAIFRIGLAAMLAWAFWSIGMKLFMPAPHFVRQLYDHFFLTHLYMALIGLVCGIFALGVRPRMTGLLLFLMLLPLAVLTRGRQSRQVLLVALLAFSFVRSDACWSLLSCLRNRSGVASLSSAGPIWPIRLIQIQLSLVYLINAIVKCSPAYLSGDVLIVMSRMKPNFLVELSDGYWHAGPIALPVALAAWGSVISEGFLAIGFWFRRLRWPAAIIGVGFHLTLQTIVQIHMLDLVSMFLYQAFLLKWRKGDE